MIRLAILIFVSGLPIAAQSPSSQPSRDAFKTWRDTDSQLEKDAVAPDKAAQIPDRASRSAAAAAKYGQARSAYLNALNDEAAELLLWITDSAAVVELDLAPAESLKTLVAVATDAATRDIATYANEKDRAFQPLRQALERERTALADLGAAIANRQKAADAAAKTTAQTETVRAAALQQYQAMANRLKESAAQSDRESAAWAIYYQDLAKSAKDVEAGRITKPPEPDVVPAPVVVSGVRITNPAKPPAPTPDTGTPPPSEIARVVNPAPPRTGPQPTLPIQRYTGAWTFPANGQAFGLQPEFTDLTVQEENGKMSGTLTARFKLPSGSSDDPEVQFRFSGDLKTARIQRLELETTAGAKGVLELIPGNAFNLLEINFQTEPKPGKIRAGNFVLVKK